MPTPATVRHGFRQLHASGSLGSLLQVLPIPAQAPRIANGNGCDRQPFTYFSGNARQLRHFRLSGRKHIRATNAIYAATDAAAVHWRDVRHHDGHVAESQWQEANVHEPQIGAKPEAIPTGSRNRLRQVKVDDHAAKKTTTYSPKKREYESFHLFEGRKEITEPVEPSLQKKTARPQAPAEEPPISFPVVDDFVGKTTEDLYRHLRHLAGKGNLEAVAEITEILVRRRGEHPNAKIYYAHLLAQTSSQGSAAQVDKLLKELKEDGITPDTELYHAALKALAVHPDYLLRHSILSDMRKRWLELSSPGWHDVIAGCVREGSLELAFETLDEMRQARVPVQGWLYDMLVFRLCDSGELDETLRLLKHRVNADEISISAGVWYYVFDNACSLLHHQCLTYIWQRRIEPLYLNPTNGQCLSVLTSASREGDVSLATDVFRILSDRGFFFTTTHYELLLQAYLRMPDLKTALTITCIMAGAQLSLTPSALSPILVHLKQQRDLPMQALAMCREMVKSESRQIPTPVLTALIEAAIHHGALNEALTIYKTLHTLCPAGPDVHVFNALFRGCHQAAELAYKGIVPSFVSDTIADNTPSTSTASVPDATNPDSASTPAPPATPATTSTTAHPKPESAPAPKPKLLTSTAIKETAMFLAAEMVHMHIEPNGLTYDRLLLCCLHQDDCSDAFRYYVEMREMGYWPRGGTWDAMVRRLREEAVRERRRGLERERVGVDGGMDVGLGVDGEGEDWGGGSGIGIDAQDGERKGKGENSEAEGEMESEMSEQEKNMRKKPQIRLDRPLERAWALISVMKERRLPTERLEALLLEVE